MPFGAHVQSRGGDLSGDSVTLDFLSNVTAGNILCCIARTGGATTDDIVISGGGTWVKSDGQWDVTMFGSALWTCVNATGGATTVQFDSASNSGTARLTISEYEGGGTAIKDQHNSTFDFTGPPTSVTSGDVTLSQNTELLFGALIVASTTPDFTPGTGYTVDATVVRIVGESRVETGGGTHDADGTLGTINAWHMMIVTFYQAAAGGSVPVLMNHYRRRKS
jgi:hypothetical protein